MREFIGITLAVMGGFIAILSIAFLMMAVDDIARLDDTVTPEEAGRLARSISESMNSLTRIKRDLQRKANS